MPASIRVALRSLRRTPGFTAVVVLTLAIGIGATTAIFSVVNAVLLNPLPYPNADRLEMIWVTNPRQEIDKDVTSYPTFQDWQQQSKSFDAIAAVTGANFTVTGKGEPKLVPGARVTGRYFDLFGVPAMLGRTLQDADAEPGRERVIVLSHALWQEHFAGDRAAVGQKLTVNALPYDVVGVMPAEFDLAQDAEAWVPLAPVGGFRDYMQSRGTYWLETIGLRKAEVTRAAAQTEMSGIMGRLVQQYPGPYDGMGILLEPMRDAMVGDARPTLLLLGGAVALVLLIVCANVAGLLVARLSARQREIAVRVAIGAGRGHLLRQLIVESLILGVAGAAAGIGLAAWGLDALLAASPPNLPRAAEIGLDLETLLFAVAVSLVAALAFGLLPAIDLFRRDPGGSLRDDARGSVGASGRTARRVLVVAEIALACVLVTGAGLLARSFMAMQQTDPGFERERLFTMRLNLPGARYQNDAATRTFINGLVEKLAALPGVEKAGAMTSVVLGRLPNSASLRIEGAQPPPPGTPNKPVTMDVVTPEVFDAMGVPLTRGRRFNSSDGPGSLPVAIVNEQFVKRFYPNEDPIGKRATFDDFDNDPRQVRWVTIVGVVASTRRAGFEQPINDEMYFPLSQSGSSSMYFFMKTAGDPSAIIAPAREAVWSMDPLLPITQARTVETLLASSVAVERFRMTLVLGFAATAMLLAALGVYGVMAFATTQRLREFGVRLALGATPRRVLMTVMRDGFILAGFGLAVGLAAAAVVARAMRQMLFGIGPFDPITFAAMALVLLASAALATFIPARRATKVDPMVVLRD